MTIKMLLLAWKNLFRSKTRTGITVLGCLVAAFIVSFFMSAQYSLDKVLTDVREQSNLVVVQKDRY